MHSQIAAAGQWLLLLVLPRLLQIRKCDRLGEDSALEVSPEPVPGRLPAVPAGLRKWGVLWSGGQQRLQDGGAVPRQSLSISHGRVFSGEQAGAGFGATPQRCRGRS